MSFIRIVGPQVAVQADGILCLVCAIRINLDAETCLVPTEFLRQSLQLTNRSNIRDAGTVGYIGDAAQSIAFTDRYIGICFTFGQICFCDIIFSCAKVSGGIGIRTDSNIAVIGAGTIADSYGCALDIRLTI